MKKRLFITFWFFLILFGATSVIHAQTIQVAPGAKVGDSVTVKFSIPQMPNNADMVNLYISDKYVSDPTTAAPYLKKSFNPSAKDYTYTWNTSASAAGNHNITVLVVGPIQPGGGRYVLSSGSQNYSLAAAGSAPIASEGDKTSEGEKEGGSSFLSKILPSNDPDKAMNYKLEDVMTLIKNVIQLALTLGGGLAVIFVVIGAYQYLTAFGSEEKATKGKTTLTWAIVGVVIIILSKVVVMEIWTFIAQEGSTPSFWF